MKLTILANDTKMQDINNGIYIGGGTGIADGIILNGEMLKLNDEEEKAKQKRRGWWSLKG